jgi:hypothetical protein
MLANDLNTPLLAAGIFIEQEKRDENRFKNISIVTEPMSLVNRPVEQLITLANELK